LLKEPSVTISVTGLPPGATFVAPLNPATTDQLDISNLNEISATIHSYISDFLGQVDQFEFSNGADLLKLNSNHHTGETSIVNLQELDGFRPDSGHIAYPA
jgi:hypothetical protein